MLLDIELTIKITNNGKDLNNTGISINQDHKLLDSLTALELAKNNITASLENYIKAKYGAVSEKTFNEILKTITFAEIYQQLQK